jgi:LPS-assembly lipoprotein
MKRETNSQKYSKIIRLAASAVVAGSLMTGLSACQFRPLYSSDQGTVGYQGSSLANLSVAEVESRTAQQVRNHLIFLLAGGAAPVNPTHEVRLRISDTNTVLAARIKQNIDGGQKGNTAGSVKVTASYEIYDLQKKEIVYRGTRSASASYDQTSQSFSARRAQRDAENRAARELAEQLRFAIGSDFSKT